MHRTDHNTNERKQTTRHRKHTLTQTQCPCAPSSASISYLHHFGSSPPNNRRVLHQPFLTQETPTLSQPPYPPPPPSPSRSPPNPKYPFMSALSPPITSFPKTIFAHPNISDDNNHNLKLPLGIIIVIQLIIAVAVLGEISLIYTSYTIASIVANSILHVTIRGVI